MSYDPNDAKSIFVQALELRSPAERAAFIGQACAGRPALQTRVETLLKSAENPDSLLDRPVASAAATEVLRGGSPVSLSFLEPCDIPGCLGRLGPYPILEVIGRGGMGIVLRATDPKLNRVVAIKVLAPEISGNPQARNRFRREAQAAAAVRHDHIVTIHAVHDEHPLPFIVMECIVGQSLQQKIDNSSPLDLQEILRIGMQIAEGLAAAHHHGLVHRDIKPANILLENGVQRVKLTDFGLARMVDDASVTQSGTIAGTPQYMSPEQAHGGDIDHRSDLFSLGCVLYAMCVGLAPFRASTTMGVLRRVCEESPPPIQEQNREIPDWLVGIVERLLQKSPDDRYQSAAEVAELLRLCLLHVQQPHTTPLPEGLPPSSPAHVATRASSSHLSSGVIIAVIGLLLLGTAGAMLVVPVLFYLLSWQGPPSSAIDVRPDVSIGTSSDASGTPASVAENTPPFAEAPFDVEQAQRLQQNWAE
ncbi:MAG TPA: serine/threonine-protein kinase [Planctomycetaceae bacterium]|nr:serine/threonine-protein kinase [Planctomycetaceae bacterium]